MSDRSFSKVEIYIRILGCYLPHVLLGLLLAGLLLKSFWLASPLFFLFIIVPALDALFKKDLASLERDDFTKLQTFLCRLAPYLFIAGFVGILSAYILRVEQLKSWEFVVALISMGAVGSIAITAAHELIHKKAPIAKFFARVGLLSVMNPHFEYSHLHGHHRDAATTVDNHTAWIGEKFTTYLIRTTFGAIQFVTKFELKRLERLGINKLSLSNKLFYFFALPILIVITIFSSQGFYAGLFFIGESIIAVASLEAVAYIEHYGLLRSVVEGRSEPMDSRHSWDSYHRFSNYLTFMLQRHADHHLNSSKDFFILRSNSQSPELPVGYPLLILLVNLPKQWFKIIHPLGDLHPNESLNSPSSKIRDYRLSQ